MATSAKTIQIFLPDGEPRGIRIAEITTRIVQAVQVPRARLDRIMQRPELDHIGIMANGVRDLAILFPAVAGGDELSPDQKWATAPDAVFLILFDGRDRGDLSPLARAMRALHARARRVIWLNPLAGDPRYEPTARAMAAALPYVDRLLPAHDLESLARLLPLLAA